MSAVKTSFIETAISTTTGAMNSIPLRNEQKLSESQTLANSSGRGETKAPEIFNLKVVPVAQSSTFETGARPGAWEKIIQSWEGRVIFNCPKSREFSAIITDRMNKTAPDEEVVIGYDSVIDSDLGLIDEGAVFFFNVGRYRKILSTSQFGPSKKKFEIRFRRLPALSSSRIEEIREISKRIAARLHGN